MSHENPEIVIDMDKKCIECARGGATQSGVCMSCILRAVQGKPMRSDRGRTIARNFRKRFKR